jgi:hypothetical protein
MPFNPYRALLCCLLVLAVVPVAPATAEHDEVVSNLELMTQLTGEAAKELIAGVPANATMGDVLLVPHEASDQYEFMDIVIARVLTAAGHKVYEAAGSPGKPPGGASETALRFEYQALHFELSYPKIYRPFLIGGKRVKRSAEVRLLAKLVDPTDQSVVWIGEAARSHDDQFSYGRLTEVEAGTFEFTKPVRSSTSWGKVVEPVVVSGIIVGLIYLFFSNQSE